MRYGKLNIIDHDHCKGCSNLVSVNKYNPSGELISIHYWCKCKQCIGGVCTCEAAEGYHGGVDE